jgi:GT2 family glycosyltransferase
VLTILNITRNRDAELKKCLDSIAKVVTGEYVVLVANCSDDWNKTAKLVSKYHNMFSFRLDPTTPIHTCYNLLVETVSTEYFTWLNDDLIVLQDLTPLIAKLSEGYDTVALPMEDVITYDDKTKPETDEYGCMYYLWKGRRLANFAIVEAKTWKSRLTMTKPMQQIDLVLNMKFTNQYWPQGKWLLHTRLMDETRKNKKL